jgi:predicted transcriptional regulator
MYETLNKILVERNVSKAKISRRADIASSDFYQMLAGKRPAFPAWRKRLAAALDVNEDLLFPEYSGGKKG